jgi:MFS family permease
MLGIAAAAQYMSAPGQSYSVAAFKEPMRDALSISETDYSLAYGFATIISGVLLPLVGRLVDRFGARKLLPTLGLLLGGACLCMSRADGLVGVYVGFGLIRPLGQGALTLVASWLVGEWFEVRRGFATAISGMGGALSVMTIPLLNNWVISEYGWRAGWVVLGVLVWAVVVLPSMIFVRDRPEQLGLHPDGIKPPKDEQAFDENGVRKIPGWSVTQVMRDATFWKLLVVPATSGMVGTGLIFHQVALLGSRGVAMNWALGLIALQALVATLAAVGAGWLTDRYPNRYLLGGAMLILSAATLLVLVLPRPELAFVYAVMLGLHGSIMRSTGTVVWLNYYGRAHQGAVRGVAFSVMILAAAIGPLPFALSVDRLGSYNVALLAFVAAPLLASAVVFTAKPPQSEATRGEAAPGS